ncbi:ATP synthase subunit d, mitochondrial-like [Stegodyphus dumicola]|uniref:ATP synthase subunit d, mitochondrial-like n=1 Tax=Stegodyphus dumicola TaxID=202533 RepID=UPI0015A9ADD7|nr:ATP synthase subunit d, mitochondrial-like [Stegodyphus dumicola]
MIDFEEVIDKLASSKYNSLKVPYPADKLTPAIDDQEKKLDVFLKSFAELCDLRSKYYEKQLNWWKDMMPFDEMTMEDYFDYFPDSKDNVYKYPNFWPHDEPPVPVFPYLDRKDHH